MKLRRVHQRIRYLLSGLGTMILAGLMIFSAPMFGSTIEIDGINFPENKEFLGNQLVLNGVGSRTFGVFNTTLYVAALYLDEKETVANKIIESDKFRLIELVYIYPYINKEDMATGWRIALNNNCKNFCEKFESEIRKFINSTVQVNQGDRYIFRFRNNEIEILHNNRLLYRSSDSSMSKLLLSTWIGDSPPTIFLKNALLGLD